MSTNKDNITSPKVTEDIEMERMATLHSDNFKQLTDIEGIIIRGHILLEHELNNAIALTILNKEEYKSDAFSFSKKVTIGYMLGIATTFKKEIAALNTLRNQIAHTLKYEEKYIDIIISEISKKYSDILKFEDKSRRLGTSISFICGAIAVAPKYTRKLLAQNVEIEEKLSKINEANKKG